MFEVRDLSRPHRRPRLTAAVALASALALALVASACGSSGADGAPSDVVTSSAGGIDVEVYRLDRPVRIPEFELTDQHGDVYRFSRADDELRLFYFGYTNCPDICPATLVKWRDARAELGDRADDVQFIMVTADPERDTPEVLGAYVENFDPAFIALSGEPDEVGAVWSAFGVRAEREEVPGSAGGYAVGHTASVFFVDGDEQVVMRQPFAATEEETLEAITTLLEEQG